MPFTDASEFFKDRFRHPFWIGFIVSWCVLNWQLFIVAIFESERMNVNFVLDNVQGVFFDRWLLLLLLLGLGNALFGHSFKEATSAATIWIYNQTKQKYAKMVDETVFTKAEYNEVVTRNNNILKEFEDACGNYEDLKKANENQLQLENKWKLNWKELEELAEEYRKITAFGPETKVQSQDARDAVSAMLRKIKEVGREMKVKEII